MMQKQRWNTLWKGLGARGDAEATYNDLVNRYSEPHRAYHTLAHIGHCFDEFDQVRDIATNLNAMELALWYHDAIYDTRAKNNEERSAELALKIVRDTSLSNSFGQSVVNLIIATKHSESPTDLDTQLIMDIDLSILGQSKEKFDEYESQIRKEYEWVSKDAFTVGRSTILQSFLDRPTIYSTQFFRNKYEIQARLNIAKSIACLRA